MKQTEVVSPFGPNILKTKVPDEMIKDFNQECDDIINKKQKKLDYSHELAGRVFEELHLSRPSLVKCTPWVNSIVKEFLNINYTKYRIPQKNVNSFSMRILSGWFVRQFEGEFNPFHWHTGCQISCIGYLKMPEDIESHWKTEDKDHNPFGGYIHFQYGTAGLNCPNSFKHKPQVGDFLMFPAILDHAVYPFKSKYRNYEPQGERRSFSFNVQIQDGITFKSPDDGSIRSPVKLLQSKEEK
tara:strand:- start:35 stop:757 length:723 start_codon:yes stop_codon:yes gene_type:complete